MKQIIFILSFTTIIIVSSCDATKKVKQNENDGISLGANHVPNNEFKVIYNSTDTISTTFIINKKTIEKSKVKSVLDTLQMQNYIINVNKQNRTIELISK